MDRGYYRMPFDQATFTDSDTQLQIPVILNEVEHYMRKRIELQEGL